MTCCVRNKAVLLVASTPWNVSSDILGGTNELNILFHYTCTLRLIAERREPENDQTCFQWNCVLRYFSLILEKVSISGLRFSARSGQLRNCCRNGSYRLKSFLLLHLTQTQITLSNPTCLEITPYIFL